MPMPRSVYAPARRSLVLAAAIGVAGQEQFGRPDLLQFPHEALDEGFPVGGGDGIQRAVRLVQETDGTALNAEAREGAHRLLAAERGERGRREPGMPGMGR